MEVTNSWIDKDKIGMFAYFALDFFMALKKVNQRLFLRVSFASTILWSLGHVVLTYFRYHKQLVDRYKHIVEIKLLNTNYVNND